MRLQKLFKWMNRIMLSMLIILGILLIGVRILGVNLFIVLSPSMEPAYKTGSLIYVLDENSEDLKIDDVITYQVEGNTSVTHRIVDIVEAENGRTFITKGDANKIKDAAPVFEKQILGKVIFSIPYLGYLVSYMQTTSGRYASIMIAGIVLLLQILPDLLFSQKNNEEEKG